jgi:poly(hydroxyalkanoate) granule-associated protein
MAAKKKAKTVGWTKANADSSAAGVLRRPFLISVGALALAEEQASGLVDSLTKRGEKAQKAGQKYIKKLMENGRQKSKDSKKKAEKKAEPREDWVLRALHWLNIPTREDIDALDKKVDALLKRVA